MLRFVFEERHSASTRFPFVKSVENHLKSVSEFELTRESEMDPERPKDIKTARPRLYEKRIRLEAECQANGVNTEGFASLLLFFHG